MDNFNSDLYFSFQMYYEMYLYSSELCVKVIQLDSGCDTNGLDICGAGYNRLDLVATDWTWEFVALAKLKKLKILQTNTNAKKLF